MSEQILATSTGTDLIEITDDLDSLVITVMSSEPAARGRAASSCCSSSSCCCCSRVNAD